MKKILFTLLAMLSLSLSAETLKLDECIDAAKMSSSAIKAQNKAVDSAELDRKVAFMSYFPTSSITIQEMYLHVAPATDTSAMPAAIKDMFTVPDKISQVSLAISQPVTPLWSVWKGVGASEIKREIEEMRLVLNNEQIAMAVTDYYYNYLMLGRIEALLLETAAQLTRYQKTAQDYINAGLTDSRGRLKIEIQQATIEKEIENVRGGQSVIKTAIALLINRDEESFELFVTEPQPELINKEIQELYTIQENRRTEIKMLGKVENVYDNLKDIAIQPFIPTIALTAGYNHNFEPTLTSPENSYTFGGVLSWNILLDWMTGYYKYEKAKSEKVKVTLQNTDTKKTLRLQIKKMYSDMKVIEKDMAIAKRSILSATENLRIEEDKYNQKLTTETDLLDASVALRKAKADLVTANYQYTAAIQKLARTIGCSAAELTAVR